MKWLLPTLIVFTVLLAGSVEASVTYNSSTNIITVSDEGSEANPIELFETIRSADVSGGWRCTTQPVTKKAYVYQCMIRVENSYVYSENKTVIFKDGTALSGSDNLIRIVNSTARFGRLKDGGNILVSYGVELMSGDTVAGYFIGADSDSNISFYDFLIKNSVNHELYITVSGENEFKYGRIDGRMRLAASPNLDFYRVDVLNTAPSPVFDNSFGNYDDVHFKAVGPIVNLIFQTGTITIEDLVARNYTSIGTFVGATATLNLINPDVPTWNFVFFSSPNAKVNKKFTFDLTLRDNEGNPISGANVLLYDKFDSLVLNETTNANGSIPTQYLVKTMFTQANTSGIDYDPYRIIISHPDYSLKNFTFTIDSPIDWTIPLEGKQDFKDLASVAFLSFLTIGLITLSFFVVDWLLKLVVVAFAGLTASGAFMIGGVEFQSTIGSLFDAQTTLITATSVLLSSILVALVSLTGYYFTRKVFNRVKGWK